MHLRDENNTGEREDNSLIDMNDRKYNAKYNSQLKMKNDDEMNRVT